MALTDILTRLRSRKVPVRDTATPNVASISATTAPGKLTDVIKKSNLNIEDTALAFEALKLDVDTKTATTITLAPTAINLPAESTASVTLQVENLTLLPDGTVFNPPEPPTPVTVTTLADTDLIHVSQAANNGTAIELADFKTLLAPTGNNGGGSSNSGVTFSNANADYKWNPDPGDRFYMQASTDGVTFAPKWIQFADIKSHVQPPALVQTLNFSFGSDSELIRDWRTAREYQPSHNILLNAPYNLEIKDIYISSDSGTAWFVFYRSLQLRFSLNGGNDYTEFVSNIQDPFNYHYHYIDFSAVSGIPQKLTLTPKVAGQGGNWVGSEYIPNPSNREIRKGEHFGLILFEENYTALSNVKIQVDYVPV